MSYTFSVSHAKGLFKGSLDPADGEWLLQAGKASLQTAKALELITGAANPDGSSTVKCSDLRMAAVQILDVIDSKSIERTRYTASAIPVPGCARMGFGSLSGIRIKGEPHTLNTGLDLCQLVRQRVDERGNVWEVEHQDVRGVKRIQTDNVGEIIIKSSRRASALRTTFRKLVKFLDAIDPGADLTIWAG